MQAIGRQLYAHSNFYVNRIISKAKRRRLVVLSVVISMVRSRRLDLQLPGDSPEIDPQTPRPVSQSVRPDHTWADAEAQHDSILSNALQPHGPVTTKSNRYWRILTIAGERLCTQQRMSTDREGTPGP